MNFVTDTHPLIWWFIEYPRLSPKISEIFEKCEKGEVIICVPSIVIAESLSIFDKNRVSFDFNKLLKRINESDNFVIIALDYPILQTMVDLKEISELHDKIIVSTVKHLNLLIITTDAVIQNLSQVKTIW